MNDPTLQAAISGLGTILALMTATLVSMAIAGIFKDISGKVRRFWEKISLKGYKGVKNRFKRNRKRSKVARK
jgi:hypothetical protein